MTIKTDDAGGITITGDDVMAYHRIAQEHALKLEIAGLSFRRSVYAHIKRTYGLKGNKQKVYDQFKAMNDRDFRTPAPINR